MTFKRISALVLAALALCAAHAQTPWPNVTHGMSEAEVQAALPAAQALRRPVSGPRGLRGLLVMPGTPVAGIPFDTTFFFRDRRLQLVEQLYISTQPGCDAKPAFGALVAQLHGRYGQELTANDTAAGAGGANVTSSWVAGDTDVVASIAESAARCSIRLIYRERVLKDADEL